MLAPSMPMRIARRAGLFIAFSLCGLRLRRCRGAIFAGMPGRVRSDMITRSGSKRIARGAGSRLPVVGMEGIHEVSRI